MHPSDVIVLVFRKPGNINIHNISPVITVHRCFIFLTPPRTKTFPRTLGISTRSTTERPSMNRVNVYSAVRALSLGSVFVASSGTMQAQDSAAPQTVTPMNQTPVYRV